MGDTIINAIWTKNVNYTIKHYLQNDTKDGYTCIETEIKTGPIGSSISAKAKAYEGYRENILHSQRIASGEITEDGNLILELYYDKLYFTKDDLMYDIKFKEISSNGNTVIAIAEDETLWGWGIGSLVDGNDENIYTPIPVPCNEKFIKVSVSDDCVIAIAKDGTLWGWGKTEYGQTEDGRTIVSKVPVQLNKEMRFKDVSGKLLIDENGTLWTWGDNTYGQLGDTVEIRTNSNILVQVKSETTFTKVATNGQVNMGIDSQGNLWIWGTFAYTLGDGTTKQSSTPIQVKEGITFKDISLNRYNILAIDNEGNLWSWGSNYDGQLGNNTKENSNVPIKLETETTFKGVSVADKSVAIDEQGNLWTWGKNILLPTKLEVETKFNEIITVDSLYMAIDTNGNLWTWGDNTYGQLGIGEIPYIQTPTKIENEITFAKIENGDTFVLALDTEGYLWTFGSNYSGLGDEIITNTKTPIKIKGDRKFKEIAVGNSFALAIDTSGNLWSWGYNGYGQLGNGTNASSKIPIQIKPGIIFEKISAGYNHSTAIDRDGNIWSWGYNYSGQLGNGTTSNSNEPVKIEIETKFKEISAGYRTSMAIDVEGNLWAWGNNSTGLYGNSVQPNKMSWEYQYVSSNVPIKVDTGTKLVKVSVGANNMIAIDEHGNLWTAGNNRKNGQSVQVMSGTKFRDISASKMDYGDYRNTAIDTNGNIWSWGYNGNGTIISPVKVNTEEVCTNVSTGNPTLALNEAGEIIIFGNNRDYSGVSTVESSKVPIQITGVQSNFTVTFMNGETVEKTQTVQKGESATAPSIDRPGYTLSWDVDFSNVTTDLTVNAIWTAKENTTYKVEHYVRNLDTEVEGYILKETEDKTGTTDTQVTATYKEYQGFTKDESNTRKVESGNIAGDGSLILKLYYSRNSYNITYELNGGKLIGTLTNNYTYGKEIILPNNKVAKEGYIFAGWYDNENLTGNPVTSIPSTAIGDKTFYVKWIEPDKEYYILSESYNIDLTANIITKVSLKTNVTSFLRKIETNGEKKLVNARGQEITGNALVGTECKLQVTYEGQTYTYEIAVRGDLDGNGEITTTDLSIINQRILNKITLTGVKAKAADIDYNGSITTTDLSMINQTVLNKITL